MRNCAWRILRGASDASTEITIVAALAPKAENDDNRKIASQQKFLTPQREPIPPPDCRVEHCEANRNSTLIYQSAAPAGARRPLDACYHLRRARAREIYYFRRPRRQRQEYASREPAAFLPPPRPLSHHHPPTGWHRYGRKDSRRAAALRHLGPFSAY